MGERDKVINIDIKIELPRQRSDLQRPFVLKVTVTVRLLICDNFGTGRGLRAKLSSHDIPILTSIELN